MQYTFSLTEQQLLEVLQAFPMGGEISVSVLVKRDGFLKRLRSNGDAMAPMAPGVRLRRRRYELGYFRGMP